ncbi:MAG: ABC transporter ATP-binding protein [bacterium]
MHLLEVENLKAGYGNIIAIDGLNLFVDEGEICTVIGANGAGKSTTLMTICGIIKPISGRVHFSGEDITGLSPDRIVERGISQVPEGRRIFPRMTVYENLLMGSFQHKKPDQEILEWVFKLFPVLKERRNQRGGTLSGGEQQMLAISRALMANPRLLLLDEPSLGLAPKYVELIFDVLIQIRKQKKTILLVEQNAHMALSIANKGYIMETGRIVLHGDVRELLNNNMVKSAYLGE